jgi:hypothetical protein
MYKKAIKLKLRFQTTQGLLSSEDLWDLNLQQLNSLAKSLKKHLKEAEEEDFLEEKSEEDTIAKLQFEIVLDVLETKKTEKKSRLEASEKKIKKEKLLGALARKEDENLEKLTVEELQAKIDEL